MLISFLRTRCRQVITKELDVINIGLFDQTEADKIEIYSNTSPILWISSPSRMSR